MKQRITIQTNTGPKDHEAYLHGKFAVNLPYSETIGTDSADSLWNVTHIATGLCVASVWNRPAARRLAQKLDASIETDITADDARQKTDAWKAFVNQVRPFVKRD